MLPEPGVWKAKATGPASVYETPAGALMTAIEFEVPESGARITAYLCLASKAGEIQQNNVRSLREAFGWDGADPFWLCDTDLSTAEVEIVVELEPDQQGQPRARVKWVNAPGAGRAAIPPQGDRRAILAKYGAKLRAMAGGTPVKPAAPAPVPPAPKAPPPVPAQPALPGSQESTMLEAWQAFFEASGGKFSETCLTELWYKAIKELAGKSDAGQCTAADWGTIKTGAAGFLAGQMQVPF